MAAGTGPGWHAHLDVLGIILEGGEFDLETDYYDLYVAAKPRYAGSVPGRGPVDPGGRDRSVREDPDEVPPTIRIKDLDR